MNTKPKLTKKACILIHSFGESAKYHGWQEDQGCGGEPAKAEAAYEADRKELEEFVAHLQQSIRLLRSQL